MAEVGAERRVFKPDFGGNFYRFLVSTGLALIGLAFTLPWVLFRQSNVLMTTRAEVAGLTPDGKQAVTRIQREQLFWLDNYWYASGACISRLRSSYMGIHCVAQAANGHQHEGGPRYGNREDEPSPTFPCRKRGGP